LPIQVHFENSLGKLTTSNFHHPRALIELEKVPQDNDDKHKETKTICTILLEIEKVIVLDIVLHAGQNQYKYFIA
jgi:hypothetical protein